MLFADFNVSTEETVAFGTILSVMAGAVVYSFKAMIAAFEARIASLAGRLSSYEQISMQALKVLEQQAVRVLGEEQKPVLEIIAPVVPEHGSGAATKEQIETARLATLRARVTAAAAAFGGEPRT